MLAIDALQGQQPARGVTDNGEDAPKNPVVVLMTAPRTWSAWGSPGDRDLWLALVPAEDAEQGAHARPHPDNIFRRRRLWKGQ